MEAADVFRSYFNILDIYIERDLAAGPLTEETSTRNCWSLLYETSFSLNSLVTPESMIYFSGDPTWVTEAIGGMGERWDVNLVKQKVVTVS